MGKDAKDEYIERLEKEIAELKKRIEELERLIGMNSQNSSRPPSSDFGQNTEPTSPNKKKRRKRKPGAQKGHEPHLRELLPPDKVTKQIPLRPTVCTCGSHNLKPSDETPIRHQIVDIPPIEPKVTEYLQEVCECQDCGNMVYESLPDDVKRTCFGPGVLALVGILTGVLNTSKRKALGMINEVFGVPMSLGGLSNCEAHLSDALEQPYVETLAYVRGQRVAHGDETGWPRGNNKRGWLWAFRCVTAAVFMVHARRSQEAAKALLGHFCGTLVSDRWNVYKTYVGIRQICWAHLKRDFKAISESHGPLGKIGIELSNLTKTILNMRIRVRDGTLQWKTFQRRVQPLMKRVEELLEKGASYEGALSGKCRDILKHRKHLWTFVNDPAVEPTNNAAKQAVRQGVLWRKGSFGTQSSRGARYVERILTVCATCRLQGKSVIEYLRNACHCHRNNNPVPSLIK